MESVRNSNQTMVSKWADFSLPIAFVVFLGVLSYVLSPRHMMWGDEFLAWHLLADASWKHAYHEWLSGADGGGISYYILGRAVMALTNRSPQIMRVYSAVCMGLGGLIWFRMLRRHYSLLAVTLSVSLMWLCNWTFLDESFQVRFYGQFVFAFALAAYGFVQVEEKALTPRAGFLIAFTSTAFMVHTHMLGLCFSGILLASLLFSSQPVQTRIWQAVGILLGWVTLAPFIQAIRSSAHGQQWIQMPTVQDVVRHYLHSSIYLGSSLLTTDIGGFALLTFVTVALWMRHRQGHLLARESQDRYLVIIALLGMLSPLGLYVVSHLGKPVFATRYLMPQLMSLCVLIALAIDVFLARVSPKLQVGIGGLAFALLAVIQIATLHSVIRDAFQPRSDLDPLLAIEGDKPVVIFNTPLWEQLWFYEGSRAHRFLMFHSKSRSMLFAPQYTPMTVLDEDFLKNTSDFLFINDPLAKLIYREFGETFLTDPRWEVTPRGAVNMQGVLAPIYEVKRVR